MLIAFAAATKYPVGHVSQQARILVLLIGLGLCAWVVTKIRNRTVLTPRLSTGQSAAAASLRRNALVETAFGRG